jgi:serpin B
MKTKIFILVVTIGLQVLTIAQTEKEITSKITKDTVNSLAQLIRDNNNFAFKIYDFVKSDTSNLFISPFSLNIALSTVNVGSNTTTRNEMDNLLYVSNISARDSLYSNLIKKTMRLEDSLYSSVDKSFKHPVYIANSIWINKDFNIKQTFCQTIKDNYHSEIFSFDKRELVSVNQRHNSWIAEKTHQKINKISGLNSDTKLSIINAIYFMSEWERPFDREKTKKNNFNTINKRKVKIDFMRDQSYYNYYEDNDIQALFLPYSGNQFTMAVLLPYDKLGIEKLEQKLSCDYLSRIENSSMLNEVILSLPKFKIETEISPNDEIIKMGYNKMFSDKADFTKISDDSLKIGSIMHKTFIELDEKKTEAAAVTEVEMVVIGTGNGPSQIPVPKIFNADHPFVFLIIDNLTKTIIFIGRYVKK